MIPFHFWRIFCLTVALGCIFPAWSADTNIGETSSFEVQFCSGGSAPYAGCAAANLRTKADALITPVAIFEYVRNNYDYALYHGARSGAINTFLGGRGGDVDLAATLISMLRSQGIPARYAVATVHLPKAQVMNWLSVEDPDLAYGLLRDMGIQKAVIASDKSTIDFEHTWVEALVPYGNYRGAGPNTVDCNATPSSCDWVPLDPSFKQRGQRVSGLDPYSSLSFDYTAYYSALKNNDVARRDKNPMEIYQEQVLSWLQSTSPGKTLEDIPDFTDIVVEANGLLPASLPYAIAASSTVRRYNSIADHDAAFPASESKKWTKYITVTPYINGSQAPGAATVDLVSASTQRLTFAFSTGNGTITQAVRLGGTQLGGALTVSSTGTVTINGQVVKINAPLVIHIAMDGAPAPDASSNDETITADYNGIIGGYYLIATGGETSNWSQVHRAAQQLLSANQQYPIVFNPADPGSTNGACDPVTHLNCTPYVDANASGAWEASDTRLLDSPAALDALSGGLLYVASAQYYATLRDNVAQLDSINKVKSPISGFLGVVSATYEAEYIDGTAFSVLPGGLLIDMKGINFAGNWRINAPSAFSNTQFELLGHVGSSLEHEIWQQLTGYDAISTVRGIQMAVNNGAFLVKAVKNSSADTVVAMYPSFNYSTTAPSSFTRNVRTLFGQSYLSYGYSGTGPNSFYAMRPDVTGLAANDPLTAIWAYSSSNGFDSFLSNYQTTYNSFLAAQTQAATTVMNIPYSVTSANFPTADVISISLVNSPGFVLASPSFVRTGTSSYNFFVNETSPLADGSYPISVNAVVSNKDGGYVLNGSVQSPFVPNNIQIITAGFSFSSPSFSGQSWSFNLLRTTAADGTYAVNFRVLVGGGAYADYTTQGIQVLGGRIVLGTISFGPGNYTVHNNTDLTCNGTTYTNQTPTVLLNALQGCFNTVVAANSGFFNFFKPSTSLVFRAYPTTNDAQLTTQISCVRNHLDQQNLSLAWGEYAIPSLLSVGINFRFGVYIRKFHDAVTGNVTGETFAISNDQSTSLNDGSLSSNCP